MIGELMDYEAELENKYCGYCIYHYGIAEDDCYCEENCGEIGCQGLIGSEKD